ncbi:mechanosensitive ion channel [Pedobacter sp. HMF7647]|uniref:Mechanosensitive ion channel n=1 Tax=Hufsiella arboris TaxID=2695275 RepID=A0A7K1Y8A2_9SPHI|nr:mechanosensitive ion channel domain-containing protein [Hufsiella arboris]MXV50650.1 mechanosensitive ion channel [Hufsiella arboris]
MTLFKSTLISFSICLVFFVKSAFASSVFIQNDTTKSISFSDKVKRLTTPIAEKSVEDYKEGQNAREQRKVIGQIENLNEKVKILLKKGIDTTRLLNEIQAGKSALNVVKDGIFFNKGTSQTQRNLAISGVILNDLLSKFTARKILVDRYSDRLVGFRSDIDSLGTNPVLFTFPKDSAKVTHYLKRLIVIGREAGPVDSLLSNAIISVQNIQNKLDLLVFELRSSIEDIELYKKQLSEISFAREFPNIYEKERYSRPLNEIIDISFAKEVLAVKFYVTDNVGRFIILLTAIVLCTVFLRSVRGKLREENKLRTDFEEQLSLRYPALSAMVISISLFQFIFQSPPFILSFGWWLIEIVCLSIIFYKFISPFWMRFWIVISLLFLVASVDNMILQASRPERWAMLVTSLCGSIYCCYILFNHHKHELKESYILLFIRFVVCFEVLSIIPNIFGRYNLAKSLMISGYEGIIIAILFLWTVRFLNEVLLHASSIYERPDKKLFYLNFNKIDEKVPGFFYILLAVGWCILIGRNFYILQQLVSPFNDFLNADRSIGEYTFSIYGLVIFLLVMVCSMVLSRIVSFFAAESDSFQHGTKESKKLTLGSWILLVRIFIISMGVFLAFAASGIPLDKLTIILGALGVGIGLGLQGLVNNLVSGLIIAFEKPVNVGDYVEVNGQLTTMKSIGFRSSIVKSVDGAHVIIPNGDLLSQHPVNWTMNKNVKRMDLTVGVAYDTDLEKARNVLKEILESDDRILEQPAPAVFAQEFSNSSIDFRLFFWVGNIRDSSAVKNDVILKISTEFRAHKITIPFPQRDINLKNYPGGNSEENMLD